MTSDDNPLADCLSYRSGSSSSRYTPRSSSGGGSSSSRGTPRTAASSVPSSARSCCSSSRSSGSGYGLVRPPSPDGVAARAQQALRGQLAVGSLVPERKESKEQQQQQQLSSVAVAASGIEHNEALRWREEVISMFPHGAPVSDSCMLSGYWLPAAGSASSHGQDYMGVLAAFCSFRDGLLVTQCPHCLLRNHDLHPQVLSACSSSQCAVLTGLHALLL
jgi:hypothetical protein